MLLANVKYEKLSTSRLVSSHSSCKVYAPRRAFLGRPRGIQARKVPGRTQGRTGRPQVVDLWLWKTVRHTASGVRVTVSVLIPKNRICAGQDLANHLVPAFIMALLWAFEIAPVEGEARPDPRNPQFVDLVVVYVYTHGFHRLLMGLISNCRCPAPFRCQFRARSDSVVRLTREVPMDA